MKQIKSNENGQTERITIVIIKGGCKSEQKKNEKKEADRKEGEGEITEFGAEDLKFEENRLVHLSVKCI